MALSGEEIRANLAALVDRYRDFDGTERSEAQTFLNQLLACYGTDRQDAGARFEERGGTGFIDMIWPGVCIVEMKRPSEAEKLEAHRPQAFAYWQEVSRKTGNAGRYVVVCAFRRFEIFEPGAFWDLPVATFSLEELPDRYDALDFLREREPRFAEDRAELTREAVALVTEIYGRLERRVPAAAETTRDFVLQCVWCMFAEDLEMIPERRFTKIVDRLVEDAERSSADELGGLFERLNTPGPRPEHGIYAGAPYADGGLFRTPARVHLEPEEVGLLRKACSFDWKLVEPAIFGSLLEGALGRERVWSFGAHYTSEDDIRKVVEPTIVEPWRERIDACETLEDVREAQDALADYLVLDPACGSGNFLYVAYRALRRIEASLRAKERELRAAAGVPLEDHTPRFPLTNMHGIELEPFAVKLARVTLWMAHKLATVELALDEEVLPLADLSGIRRADALKVEWPNADAIIGNPPYHGSQQIRSELGSDYAEWLKREFGIGLKDFAVYWFRKAHEALPAGGRAGLVATNSVSQGRSREVSLQWIVESGGVITNAMSRRRWPGAAAVNVSIVNWVNDPDPVPSTVVLDEVEVGSITGSLKDVEVDVATATRLQMNRAKAFQGPIPTGAGFVLLDGEAQTILDRDEANYAEVIRPYLTSDDITDDPRQAPRRWIIDFGKRPLEEAAAFPCALEIVRERVKPERDRANREPNRTFWWQFERPRVEMRQALAECGRYIAGVRHGVRLDFCWVELWTMASDATNVFAFDEDYPMGLLGSSVHRAWVWSQSSTIRSDIRYTPSSAFETFPWPPPTHDQREGIAEASRGVIIRRSEICLEREIGLTKLYNEVDDGAYRDLRKLHDRLDEAVVVAYGWPKRAAHDPAESNRRLLELNRKIAAGEIEYAPFD